jgi:2-polyprenyl-6-methoxyphenol hydroxylase-like FAD-dependent oxidoreductase/predicted SnoaL-like aldol condensation-catalyzing enzyme
MKKYDADIVIAGAGPVGLMCAYLSHLCGMTAIVLDPSAEPLQVGRADALNARTLQLLEIADLFKEFYPLGKPCNTSSVWAKGQFLSRQSSWWDELEGCFHKHFLMLGQAYVEKLLDAKLRDAGAEVKRLSSVEDVLIDGDICFTKISNGSVLRSKFVIGADGSRSRLREKFQIPFEITRPQIVWAVIDGIIETDFEKVSEIIVFQAETSDVAWIPREGEIDRFYIRMDTKEFTLDEAIAKINRAMAPHTLKFKKIEWFSHFSVKESVAERFSIKDKVFLAGDACHIHSVNGGQGLNTGLADAFNLIWKLSMVTKSHAPMELLKTYEAERKPVALSVIEASGELVRSTKYSETGTHAEDYVKIVKKRSGNITGMGIRYGNEGLVGQRLFDFELNEDKRIYSLLDYSKYTLLIFGEPEENLASSQFVQIITIENGKNKSPYSDQAILVRPDSYIEAVTSLDKISSLLGGELVTNKQKARAYHTAVSNYDQAKVCNLVDENYIQHNPRVPTGRAAFVSLLPKLKQHGSKIENKRMIQDGPYIAMHHVWKNAIPFGGNEMAAFHIIRFDSAGLIAEHWNVMSPLAQSPVEGETDIKDLIETEANKTQVINLFSAQQGKRQHKVIGEGNFVLSISEGNHGKKPTAFYDLFRLDQGKIVEQWSVSQEIPQENLANTNTMFNFV